MRIECRQLGLGAYIKMNGGELLEVSDGKFIFESDKSYQDWRLQYANSCCSQHDLVLCELRRLLNSN